MLKYIAHLNIKVQSYLLTRLVLFYLLCSIINSKSMGQCFHFKYISSSLILKEIVCKVCITKAHEKTKFRLYKIGLYMRKPDFVICEKQRHRPDCASMHADQHFRYSVCGKQYVVCATSKALDQPVHMRSLIEAYARRLSIL